MPRTPTRRRRPFIRAALATLTGLLVVAGVACGGDDDDGDETGTDPTAAETTSTPPTTAPVMPEDEAKTTYLEFVATVERLLTTSRDPNDTDLNRLAVDPVLSEVKDNLTTMRTENHVVTPGPRTSHTVTAVVLVTPTEAEVSDCYVGNDTTSDADDGTVLDEGLSTRSIKASLALTEGGWAVSDVTTLEILDGETSCAG
jgi:hypothetical protein